MEVRNPGLAVLLSLHLDQMAGTLPVSPRSLPFKDSVVLKLFPAIARRQHPNTMDKIRGK